jgi:hypothetical protein
MTRTPIPPEPAPHCYRRAVIGWAVTVNRSTEPKARAVRLVDALPIIESDPQDAYEAEIYDAADITIIPAAPGTAKVWAAGLGRADKLLGWEHGTREPDSYWDAELVAWLRRQE